MGTANLMVLNSPLKPITALSNKGLWTQGTFSLCLRRGGNLFWYVLGHKIFFHYLSKLKKQLGKVLQRAEVVFLNESEFWYINMDHYAETAWNDHVLKSHTYITLYGTELKDTVILAYSTWIWRIVGLRALILQKPWIDWRMILCRKCMTAKKGMRNTGSWVLKVHWLNICIWLLPPNTIVSWKIVLQKRQSLSFVGTWKEVAGNEVQGYMRYSNIDCSEDEPST